MAKTEKISSNSVNGYGFLIQGWWAEISYDSGLIVQYDGKGCVQSLDVMDFEVGENEESRWKDITDTWPKSDRSVKP